MEIIEEDLPRAVKQITDEIMEKVSPPGYKEEFKYFDEQGRLRKRIIREIKVRLR